MKVAFDEILKLAKPIAFLTIVTLVLFALFGKLNISLIIGVLFGNFVAIIEFFLLGISVSHTVEQKADSATSKMVSGYFFRLGIVAICFFITTITPFVSTFGFVLPLFYPRLAIYYNALKRKGEHD